MLAGVDRWQFEFGDLRAKGGLILKRRQPRDPGLLVRPLRRGLKPRPMTNVKD